MKQSSSNRRVNEQARQVIAETLMFEISDPRLSMVTVTGCEVSFDRSVCNVYYTTSPGSYEASGEAFGKAAGRIRSLLARKLSWRTSPELRFFIDESVDEAERIAWALESERGRMTADGGADGEQAECEAEVPEGGAAEAAGAADEAGAAVAGSDVPGMSGAGAAGVAVAAGSAGGE